MSTGPDRPDAGADDDRTSDRTARILGGATAADGSLDDLAGRRPRTGSARERSARLDEALAQYRDTTYATWTAPGGPVDVSPSPRSPTAGSSPSCGRLPLPRCRVSGFATPPWASVPSPRRYSPWSSH